MRKFVYLTITLCVCYILGLWHIWLGFVPALLAIGLFKIRYSFLWEIPIAVLSCSILEIAFADELKLLLHILVLFSTVIISLVSPRRLLVFFLIAVIAMFFENEYSVASVWATLWYGAYSGLRYFTTKEVNLQEYKL
ncbi:MAG: hypothetical protein IJZ81_04605 [Clostridia bacterium]|nr:hypothetical protein [Clostridia bacterium]